jgi:hypothetical protein
MGTDLSRKQATTRPVRWGVGVESDRGHGHRVILILLLIFLHSISHSSAPAHRQGSITASSGRARSWHRSTSSTSSEFSDSAAAWKEPKQTDGAQNPRHESFSSRRLDLVLIFRWISAASDRPRRPRADLNHGPQLMQQGLDLALSSFNSRLWEPARKRAVVQGSRSDDSLDGSAKQVSPGAQA